MRNPAGTKGGQNRSKARFPAVLLVLGGIAFALGLFLSSLPLREAEELSVDVGAAEPDARIPRCGNGHLDVGEDCDSPDDTMLCADLVSNGATSIEARCDDDCLWELEVCLDAGAQCGNGVVEPGELCDDGNRQNSDGCDTTCVIELAGERVHYDGPSVDVSIARALTGSVCLDPDAWPEQQLRGERRVPVRLFVCTLPTGQPVYPVERIRSALHEANEGFAQAGIVFVEEAAFELPFAGSCRVPYGAPSLRARAAESRAEGSLPLFFVGSIDGGGVSSREARGFAAFGYGAVLSTTSAGVMSHELGHVLGLAHTHACSARQSSSCSDSGDGLCDTPFDPGPQWLGKTCSGHRREVCSPECGAAECSEGAQPDRENYMSYFTSCFQHFSTDQLRRMRCVVENDLPWLHPEWCGAETCNRVDDDCDGAIDEGDVCTESCLPFDQIGVGTTQGTTRGWGEAFGGREYPEGSPDRLLAFRPEDEGIHCIRSIGTGSGASTQSDPVVALRDTCRWNSTIVASNLGRDPGELLPHFSFAAVPSETVWVSVDGYGKSDGMDFRLAIGRGGCAEQNRAATPSQEESAARRRSVDMPALVAPHLISPHDSERLVSLSPVLSWSPVLGATDYECRLGTNLQTINERACEDCSSWLVSSTEYAVHPIALQTGEDYFWTVRALRQNEGGPFARPRYFEVEPWACTAVGRILVDQDAEATLGGDWDEDDLITSCGNDSASEHVWMIVPAESGPTCIYVESEQFDTVLSVRRQCERAETEIACNNDSPAGSSFASQVQVETIALEPLFAIIEGNRAADAGDYWIQVRGGPCP